MLQPPRDLAERTEASPSLSEGTEERLSGSGARRTRRRDRERVRAGSSGGRVPAASQRPWSAIPSSAPTTMSHVELSRNRTSSARLTMAIPAASGSPTAVRAS